MGRTIFLTSKLSWARTTEAVMGVSSKSRTRPRIRAFAARSSMNSSL